MCKICIARRLVVDIFPWCNANFVPFRSGTLVARQMRNGRIKNSFQKVLQVLISSNEYRPWICFSLPYQIVLQGGTLAEI